MWSAVIILLVMLATALITYLFCRQRMAVQYKDEIGRLELANSRLEANLKNCKNTAEEYQRTLIQLKDAGVNIAEPQKAERNKQTDANLSLATDSVASDVAVKKVHDHSTQYIKTQQGDQPQDKKPSQKNLPQKLDATSSHANTESNKNAVLTDDKAGVNKADTSDNVAGNEQKLHGSDVTPKPATTTQKNLKKSGITENKKVATTSDFDAKAVREIMGKRIKHNDLKVVEGIGPKIAELFAGANVDTWQELADMSVAECQAILDGGGGRYAVHSPQTWPEQAKLAAKGSWQELKALQDELKGGRP